MSFEQLETLIAETQLRVESLAASDPLNAQLADLIAEYRALQAQRARATTDAWKQAYEQVAQRYPGSVYNFGQAGPSIDVPVSEGRGLTFGVCSDMIGADVSILPEWEPTGAGGIDTDVSSDCADADLIAHAILNAAREYTFELDREFDRTHPGYWDWTEQDNATPDCDEGCQATHALPDWAGDV